VDQPVTPFPLALPVVLYQVWSFFAPAFEQDTREDRRRAHGVRRDPRARGLAFGYFVALPALPLPYERLANLYYIQIPGARTISPSPRLFFFAVTIDLPRLPDLIRPIVPHRDLELCEAPQEPPDPATSSWRPIAVALPGRHLP